LLEGVSCCKLPPFSDLFVLIHLPRREYYTSQPFKTPTIAPTIVKLTLGARDSRPISPEDIEKWRTRPEELVGNCFISTDLIRRIFVIDDYSVKCRKGPQYEVVLEDLGLDEVQTLDPETLLEMVAEAKLVVNALPRSG